MSDGQKNRTHAKVKSATSKHQKTSAIECRPELGLVAREMWNRLIPLLSKKCVLSPFDQDQIAIYCTAYSYWLNATEALQIHGTMLKAPSGYPVQSPYVSIAKQNAETMTAIANKYGFLLVEREVPRLKPLIPEEL
jgi:P27 family predicted phage terminase small subunit